MVSLSNPSNHAGFLQSCPLVLPVIKEALTHGYDVRFACGDEKRFERIDVIHNKLSHGETVLRFILLDIDGNSMLAQEPCAQAAHFISGVIRELPSLAWFLCPYQKQSRPSLVLRLVPDIEWGYVFEIEAVATKSLCLSCAGIIKAGLGGIACPAACDWQELKQGYALAIAATEAEAFEIARSSDFIFDWLGSIEGKEICLEKS